MRKTTHAATEKRARIEIEEITPQRAKELIQFNTGNFRSPQSNRVARYAKEMKEGKWDLTGDTIKISNNVIIDGQHRLLAVIASGATIFNAVAYEVASKTTNIDRGMPRSICQILTNKGIKNASNVGAAAKYCVQHDKGLWARDTVGTHEIVDSEVLDYAAEYNEELQAAITFARSSKVFAPLSVISTVIHVGCNRSSTPESNDLVQWFWNGVSSGEGLESVEAPLALRNRLIAAKIQSSKPTRHFQRMLITLAWNNAVKDIPIQKGGLRLRLTGPAKQELPKNILVALIAPEEGY